MLKLTNDLAIAIDGREFKIGGIKYVIDTSKYQKNNRDVVLHMEVWAYDIASNEYLEEYSEVYLLNDTLNDDWVYQLIKER